MPNGGTPWWVEIPLRAAEVVVSSNESPQRPMLRASGAYIALVDAAEPAQTIAAINLGPSAEGLASTLATVEPGCPAPGSFDWQSALHAGSTIEGDRTMQLRVYWPDWVRFRWSVAADIDEALEPVADVMLRDIDAYEIANFMLYLRRERPSWRIKGGRGRYGMP